ncbi:twin-arginine translocase TatA/TatE family subunit [Qipengyuania zhejiangensis]|uniref:twin-arginine translocase TatA/TatE family subunit n=1 Tax=Qipengyuania zhejiangensis TaxID=3077782 RepID=UPI002D797112|nr:twin-arginine translocase TatA/TatE family subunit [Qipengyuania sp. Z2]
MSLGPWQLIIIAIVILVLFGRGRISEMMGDFGKGIKSFKQGMNEEDAPSKPAGRIEGPGHEAKPAEQAAQDPQPAPRSDTPDMRG